MSKTETYLLRYPACCRLARYSEAEEYFRSLEPVDSIDDVSAEMWEVITDIGIWEWYRIRLPGNEASWGEIYLPDPANPIFFMDKQRAQSLSSDIDSRYPQKIDDTLFAGYLVDGANDIEVERTIMDYLARQVQHFESENDYVMIVHRKHRRM